jgi:hypothetical protein
MATAHPDRVVPFFDSQEVKLLRVLADRGSEYCGNPVLQLLRLGWKP